MRLRKKTEPWPRVVGSYERRLWHVSQENHGLKSRALASKAELADYERRLGLLAEAQKRRRAVETLERELGKLRQRMARLNA